MICKGFGVKVVKRQYLAKVQHILVFAGQGQRKIYSSDEAIKLDSWIATTYFTSFLMSSLSSLFIFKATF